MLNFAWDPYKENKQRKTHSFQFHQPTMDVLVIVIKFVLNFEEILIKV